MKVLFTGLSYFSKKIVNELKEFDKENKYVFCDTYISKKDKLRFLAHLPSADLVVSFNGASRKSGTLDSAIFLKKKIMMQWHGSDVLSVVRHQQNGEYTSKYIDAATSYTDAIWLKESLDKLGVKAEMLHFKHVEVKHETNAFKEMGAVSYIAEGKEEMYGIDKLIFLADAFPEITFNVIGSSSDKYQNKKNVVFHGWLGLEERQKIMNRYPVYIRLTSHDGFSLSIMEALANGNYVLWNNPHEMCYVLKDEKKLVDLFEKIKTDAEKNKLQRLSVNMKWVEENFNRETVLNKYVTELKRLAGK